MTAIFPGRGRRWYSSAAWASCASMLVSDIGRLLLLLRDVEVCDGPLEGLGGHADGLREGGMRVDGRADVPGARFGVPRRHRLGREPHGQADTGAQGRTVRD